MGSLAEARIFVGCPDLQGTCWPHQVDVLREQGLLPGHTLLEIGAGCLGVGRMLIDYLNPGNYWALEPNKWLIDAAGVLKRKFHLYTFRDFKLSRISARKAELFDFVLAHSIFTHADRSQIRTILSEARKVLKPGGKLVASFFDCSSDSEHVGWMYPNGCSYTKAFIRELAEEAGFEVEIRVDPRHPIQHMWLYAVSLSGPQPGGPAPLARGCVVAHDLPTMHSLTLTEEAIFWQDSESYAMDIFKRFVEHVNADPDLKEHRDFVEKQAYGFGDRAFYWLWKLIVDELPNTFRFLEVGIYKGQVPSLIWLLARREGKCAQIYGVTLLSSFGGEDTTFPDEDYRQHIEDLHNRFGQPMPKLIVGDSTDAGIHARVKRLAPFDVVYIDGCHDYDYVVKDLIFYPTLLKQGGLLVVDDCACDLKQPWGFFQGIRTVCDAVRTIVLTDPQWKHIFTVLHDRVWRKT